MSEMNKETVEGMINLAEGMEKATVKGYEAIEETVVDTYKTIEETVVGAYKNIEGKFVDKFLAKDGETTEEAKARVMKEQEEMSHEIMERYAVICESRETIEALEKDRKTTKIVCPECGAKSSAKMNYCGNCGTKLQKEDVDDAAENDIVEVHEEETIEEGNVNEEE